MRPRFSSNDKLVDYLVRNEKIESEEVEDAFRKTDRREFISDEQSDIAYVDTPVPINDVTISAPHMVAIVTELLELSGIEKVLEIGSGSGYQAAILGELADEVIGVEIEKSLAEKSREHAPKNVTIKNSNGFGDIDESFDRILFSCAVDNFEEAENYIKENGIIVGPVKENGNQVLKKWKNGYISTHGKVRYVEMQD